MLKPQKKQSNANQNALTFGQASFYSGKLPPPEMMQQYNDIEPTFANRILEMAEKESIHTHKLENKQLNIASSMAIIGILSGLLALGTLCYLLYLSIEKENSTIAVAIIGIIAVVVSIFVFNKRGEFKPQ